LNLISNAIKYSPPEALVEIHADGKGSAIDVSVTDHGFGLSDQDIEHLFQKFSRIDRPELREIPGTGLGLFITKSLVELQGGALDVQSVVGHGTTFTFSLPVERAGMRDG
ncbi:MAG: sensor histidine kinase, partial [Actinomycetota bacterium]